MFRLALALQAVGIVIRRSRGVLVDGTVSPCLPLYALLVSGFLGTVGHVLQLTVVLLGPSTAVCAADIVLRRNRYDGKRRPRPPRAAVCTVVHDPDGRLVNGAHDPNGRVVNACATPAGGWWPSSAVTAPSGWCNHAFWTGL